MKSTQKRPPATYRGRRMSCVDCYGDYDYMEGAWNERKKTPKQPEELELLSSYTYFELMLKE